MKKGIIYLNKSFKKENHLVDRYTILFDNFVKEKNCKIVYLEKDFDGGLVPNDIDYVILFKILQPYMLYSIKNIEKISNSIKVVSYFTDCHLIQDQENNNNCYLNLMEIVLNRSDLVLSPYKQTFLKYFKNIENKFYWFPNFYADSNRYSKVSLNSNRKLKCLISGNLDEKIYPIRFKIANSSNSKNIDVIKHPGYIQSLFPKDKDNVYMGDRYAELLSQYKIAFTDHLAYNYNVAKYFEIPASGALLMATTYSEITELGFKDKINYIHVDDEIDFEIKLNDIINNYRDYENVALEGKKFVENNHSVEKRLSHLNEILKGIVD